MITLLLVILISAVASARVFRLLVVDEITYPLRNVVGKAPALAREGFECPWCLGYWLSLAFVLTGLLAFDSFTWWGLVAGSLTANYIGARLNGSEE